MIYAQGNTLLTATASLKVGAITSQTAIGWKQRLSYNSKRIAMQFGGAFRVRLVRSSKRFAAGPFRQGKTQKLVSRSLQSGFVQLTQA
jgi:hypothetical protein